MSVPAQKHRFVTKIAEIAQDIMRRKVTVTLDGEGNRYALRHGLSGQVLDALYNKRLDDLRIAMRATPLGNIIMDYLDAQGVYLDFNHRMSARGSADFDKIIHLRPSASNAELLSVLAHEARHIWQFGQLRDVLAYTLPPQAVIGCDRLMEADARVFQQLFAQDYLRRTGDARVLESFNRTYKDAQHLHDPQAMFRHYMMHLRKSVFVARSLERSERNLDLAARGKMRLSGTQADVPAIVARVARAICLAWPRMDGQGGHINYIPDVSADEMQQLTQPGRRIASDLFEQNLRYNGLQSRAADTPTGNDAAMKKAPA